MQTVTIVVNSKPVTIVTGSEMDTIVTDTNGWANRLATHVASAQSSPLLYANLAIRGRNTRQIRDEQLEPARTMRPDLVTLFTGVNDVTSRRFDADAVGGDAEYMQRVLIENGATVIGFTLPDLSLVMPITRLFSGRVRALNDALRRASAASGALSTPWSRSWAASILAELRWQRDYFLPWLWRHARGRSSGDNRGPKLPSLTKVETRSS